MGRQLWPERIWKVRWVLWRRGGRVVRFMRRDEWGEAALRGIAESGGAGRWGRPLR